MRHLALWPRACLVFSTMLALLAGRLSIGAEPEKEKGTTRLKGVVVSKKSGQPLEGVSVGMAHAQQGRLQFSEPGSVQATGGQAWGWDGGEMANTKTAVNAETEEDGRFTLSSFTTPDEPYHLGVAHPQHGAVLLLDLKPEDYVDRELRIELDGPGFIRTDDLEGEYVPGSRMRGYTRLTLVRKPKEQTEEEEQAQSPVWGWPKEYGGDPEDADPDDTERRSEPEKPGFIRYGPLPTGHQYRLGLYAYSPTMPYQATIFERLITPEAGQTVEVRLKDLPGATVSGRLTDTDGKPLKMVNVLIRSGSPDELVLGAVTDKDGRYEIGGVPAGEHKLELLRHRKRTTPG